MNSMELGAATALLGRAFAPRSLPAPDRAAFKTALAAITRLRAGVDALEASYAAELARLSSFGERDIAEATRTGTASANRVLDRAKLLAKTPEITDAFTNGDVTAGHVDALGRALRSLEPAQQNALLAKGADLAKVASTATVEEFARHVRREAAGVQTDDGMDRLERQRRAVRLRWWVDAEGMVGLAGRYDPLTGALLTKRLDSIVAALFAESTPPDCPSDPIEKQAYLRALALQSLINGQAAGSGRTETVAVIDTDQPGPTGAPAVDWGLPVEVPARVLADLFDTTDTTVVIVRNGIVLYAPGELNLGRTTRIASKAQRRALRALYRTCAIPGCTVHYDLTKAHHVWEWEHGGPTDLHNLLPLCVRHHHNIHDNRWKLALGPNRQLTITYPDGTIQTTGPPTRRAAA
jgi:Domain of unknown function (DUF222)